MVLLLQNPAQNARLALVQPDRLLAFLLGNDRLSHALDRD